MRNALKRIGGFLDDALSNREPANWCRKNFGIVFGSILLATPLALLATLHLLTPIQGLVAALILLVPALWAGNRFYDGHVGPRFRAKGWDECSYWKNLLLIPVFVFVIYSSVVLLILAIQLLFGF